MNLATEMGRLSGRATPSLQDGPSRQSNETGRRSTYLLPIAVQTNRATSIRARKYHGLRESEPHKQLKAMLLRCLDADPSFSDIATEQHWKSSTREKAYRRPDVQAEDSSGKIAFEVQLSTTFLRVVVGRRDFYREESALLIWLFRGFERWRGKIGQCDEWIFCLTAASDAG
ncbi:DUF6035 family protein [Sphingopyxis chilensis]